MCPADTFVLAGNVHPEDINQVNNNKTQLITEQNCIDAKS